MVGKHFIKYFQKYYILGSFASSLLFLSACNATKKPLLPLLERQARIYFVQVLMFFLKPTILVNTTFTTVANSGGRACMSFSIAVFNAFVQVLHPKRH